MVQPQSVNAWPTKEFFVDMLTRDVRLPMAILDLIDNCIDGALRLRGEGSFEGLSVHLTFNQDQFVIQDNCGGITLDRAQRYAFRFGRPKGAEPVPNSVGRFGVGMKRALFKIGRRFELATRTVREEYSITGDVDVWLNREEWDFPINNYQRRDQPIAEDATGTTITVTRLTADTQRWFALPQNESSLKTDISTYHQQYIDRGLIVSLNGFSIPTSQLGFLTCTAPLLQPLYTQYVSDHVRVRLIAGVGESSPNEAGWYIYCNGRKVLDADRTRVTGWGEPGMTPRFHNQYARFRGAVFFDSADSSLLPWNTTKDGVDEGLPVFSQAYRLMVEAMKSVLRFLDRIDREINEPEGWKPLTQLVERQAQSKPISMLRHSDSFAFSVPSPPGPPPEPQISIQYRKPVRLVNAVKESLGVDSARQAGEDTFDYYVEQEGIDAC